jgi:hypothetical protein
MVAALLLAWMLAAQTTLAAELPGPEDAKSFGLLADRLNEMVKQAGSAAARCAQAPAAVASPQAACRAGYDKLFASGDFTYGVGLGYWDPVTQFGTSNNRYMTMLTQLVSPCTDKVTFACGFSQADLGLEYKNDHPVPGTSFTVLHKTVEMPAADGGSRKVTIRVPLCNPESGSRDPKAQENQRKLCAALFARSTKYDPVTVYLGHSESLGGPDFFPTRTLSKATKEAHQKTLLGPGAFQPLPYKQFYVLSCNSQKRLAPLIRASAENAGYAPGALEIAGTNMKIATDGTEPLSILESLGRGECASGLQSSYEGREDKFVGYYKMGDNVEVSTNRPGELNVSELFKAPAKP